MVRHVINVYLLVSTFLKRNHSRGLAVLTGRLTPKFKQTRRFLEKGPDKGAKEEESSLKMPGFAHPEDIQEEGYFTQKAKKQLEELKRKKEPPTVENPEKKL